MGCKGVTMKWTVDKKSENTIAHRVTIMALLLHLLHSNLQVCKCKYVSRLLLTACQCPPFFRHLVFVGCAAKSQSFFAASVGRQKHVLTTIGVRLLETTSQHRVMQ
jgi:hypothetical protein